MLPNEGLVRPRQPLSTLLFIFQTFHVSTGFVMYFPFISSDPIPKVTRRNIAIFEILKKLFVNKIGM